MPPDDTAYITSCSAQQILSLTSHKLHDVSPAVQLATHVCEGLRSACAPGDSYTRHQELPSTCPALTESLQDGEEVARLQQTVLSQIRDVHPVPCLVQTEARTQRLRPQHLRAPSKAIDKVGTQQAYAGQEPLKRCACTPF